MTQFLTLASGFNKIFSYKRRLNIFYVYETYLLSASQSKSTNFFSVQLSDGLSFENFSMLWAKSVFIKEKKNPFKFLSEGF